MCYFKKIAILSTSLLALEGHGEEKPEGSGGLFIQCAVFSFQYPGLKDQSTSYQVLQMEADGEKERRRLETRGSFEFWVVAKVATEGTSKWVSGYLSEIRDKTKGMVAQVEADESEPNPKSPRAPSRSATLALVSYTGNSKHESGYLKIHCMEKHRYTF